VGESRAGVDRFAAGMRGQPTVERLEVAGRVSAGLSAPNVETYPWPALSVTHTGAGGAGAGRFAPAASRGPAPQASYDT
jgi:hypothetical protein